MVNCYCGFRAHLYLTESTQPDNNVKYSVNSHCHHWFCIWWILSYSVLLNLSSKYCFSKPNNRQQECFRIREVNSKLKLSDDNYRPTIEVILDIVTQCGRINS